MGFRFNKRIKICKGLYINVGKKGVSSVSAKIGKVSVNSKGTVGVSLGHGLSYRTSLKGKGTVVTPEERPVRKPFIDREEIKRKVSTSPRVPLRYPAVMFGSLIVGIMFPPFLVVTFFASIAVIYKSIKVLIGDKKSKKGVE